MVGRFWAPLALVAALGGGCHTAVGNYFANRARDLGECVRLEVGTGIGLELGAATAGLLHAGIGMAVVPEAGTLGWSYGEPLVPGVRPANAPMHAVRTSERWWPTAFFAICGKSAHFGHWAGAGPAGRGVHTCYLLMPCVMAFSQEDRWARVHAFDIEIGGTALFARARAGFSPGEFVDFLLGWFGVDIAGDDRPLAPPAGG